MPNTSDKMAEELLSRYDQIMSGRGANPEWAVHKRNTPDELVKCAIPFVGTYYAEQEKKILVYASAENLVGYYLGNTNPLFQKYGVSQPILRIRNISNIYKDGELEEDSTVRKFRTVQQEGNRQVSHHQRKFV